MWGQSGLGALGSVIFTATKMAFAGATIVGTAVAKIGKPRSRRCTGEAVTGTAPTI
jgi:hypothetical protein